MVGSSFMGLLATLTYVQSTAVRLWPSSSATSFNHYGRRLRCKEILNNINIKFRSSRQ